MSIKAALKAVKTVFGVGRDHLFNGSTESALDARGVYCYVTSAMNVSQKEAAELVGLSPSQYAFYSEMYRHKVVLDTLLFEMTRNVRTMIEDKLNTEFVQEIKRDENSIRTNISGQEYKAIDMSSQYGESFMAFIDDVYVTEGESLEDAFINLLHNEILGCIVRLPMETLRKALMS